MARGNLALVFAAIAGAGVVIEYGVRSTRSAFAKTGGSSGLPTSNVSGAPSSASGSAAVKDAGAVLQHGGFSKTAAAGVLGNALQESGWDPASVGSGGGGLWGFTAHPMSLADLQAYAQGLGRHWTDPTLQAMFLLKNTSSSQIAAMNAQPTPEAAASWWMTNWERPAAATANEARRQAGARQALGLL